MTEGRVYLVGAGPGDPELLTVKALRLLSTADIVLYDRLVTDGILDLISESAEKIYVGKQPGKPSVPQEKINEMMVEATRKGKTVVRLKGGDPFLFGRGGEEAQELRRAGVKFEVVPGISSAISVPAYAGIPLTHRDYASSVAIVTGHEATTKKESSVRWENLASLVDTIVIMMGVGRLESIAHRLLVGGRDPETPVAIIEGGTTDEQRIINGTLSDIAGKAKEQGVRPPAVIAIGDVVNLQKELYWLDNDAMPLDGRVIAITRPERQAHKMAELVSKLGGIPYVVPMVETSPPKEKQRITELIDRVLQGQFDFLIFLSANSITSLFEIIEEAGLRRCLLKKVREIPVIAIGPKTRRALERHGIRTDIVPRRYSTEGILEVLDEIGLKGKRVGIPRSSEANEDLRRELEKRDAEVYEVVAYESTPPSDLSKALIFLDDLFQGKIDSVTFTSASTAMNMFGIAEDHALIEKLRDSLNKTIVAAIGPMTQRVLEESGVHVDVVPKKYTVKAMVKALAKHYNLRVKHR